jgi:multicomponent K+:H+ antiporter subunit F
MTLLQTLLPWVQGAFLLALLLNAWRLWLGPSLADRILALDAMTVNGTALFVLVGLATGSTLLVEAALLIGLLGFVATVALARFGLAGAGQQP